MFSRGLTFECIIGEILRSAKVIAIVDGGRIGWLAYLDAKGPPFELDTADRSAWKLVQCGR